ncbi:CoA-transferase subunit beta [Clostridia bacterium OttesenSCG-928-F22]|nr:CoA-transferase subunit beta [Clostridia bacterium OttesenSCG-928-F22]
MEYTNKEMQIVAISRQIKDGQNVVVGTGLPLGGAALAKKTVAPTAVLIVETGIVGADPGEAPTSVGDLRVTMGASVGWEQYRYFGLQTNSIYKNNIDLAFIGGAQIDPYGNVNSTSIGDYHRPKTRFSGSGGANGIASFLNTIIMMRHQKRRFVEQVDYLTSPGWIDGPDGREKMGLMSDRGPQAVITDLGIMKFDDKTKRMYLSEYFPGVTVEQILENTGFEMDVSRAVEAKPPEESVLKILREVVDPARMFIGKP